MRYFISQPMKGRSDEEIKSERANIEKAIRKQDPDAAIIDSYFEGAPHDARPLWFLGKSFELLSTADICVFQAGAFCAEYRGCYMEYEACLRYDIPIKVFDPDTITIEELEDAEAEYE